MKTELLAAYVALGDLLNALPNDPAAPAPTPTGLRVASSYVMGEGVTGVYPDNRVLALGLAWDYDYPSTPVLLEVKGTDDNPAGPQEWTPQPYNGSGPDGQGTMFSYVQSNPAGQAVIFRVRYQNADGVYGEACQLAVYSNDYLF